MKRKVLVIAALAMAPVFAADPLQCPAGAVMKRDPGLKNGKREEWCQDTTTGKQNGPARSVNAAGAVLLTAEARQGKVVSHRFTRAGLEQLLSEVNEGFTRRGQPAHFTLIDEQTLRFDMTLDGAKPGSVAIEEFKKMVVTQAPICRMVALGGTDFRTINIHATNEKKEQLGTAVVTRAECDKAAPR